MEFEGVLGRKIIMEDDNVSIKVTGMVEKLNGMPSVKIEYNNISTIELKKEDFFKKGFVHFIVAGSGFERGTEKNLVPKQNPYLVHFSKDKYSDAELLVEKINQKIKLVKNNNAAPSNSTSNNPDILEQISKLASLKDAGVLTEEEFNQKKADLLLRL